MQSDLINTRSNCRQGISLIELVTAMMTVGVFSAMTVPVIQTQRDSPLQQTTQELQQVRDAITFFHAEYGSFPSGTELQVEVEKLLGRPFPKCPVGNTNNQIRIEDNAKESIIGREGWSYAPETGQFRVNSSKYASM